MMWHAGLRGGIALVLTLELGPWVDQIDGKGSKEALRNCTLVVICGFMLVFGGSTKFLLTALKIPIGQEDMPEDALVPGNMSRFEMSKLASQRAAEGGAIVASVVERHTRELSERFSFHGSFEAAAMPERRSRPSRHSRPSCVVEAKTHRTSSMESPYDSEAAPGAWRTSRMETTLEEAEVDADARRMPLNEAHRGATTDTLRTTASPDARKTVQTGKSIPEIDSD